MQREILYIIGEPGVGKSTLMNYLTRDLPAVQIGGPPHEVGDDGWHPVPHIQYFTTANVPVAIQLGCMHHSGFHGTDRLRRDIMPFLLRWVVRSFEGIDPSVANRIAHPDTFRGKGYPGLEEDRAETVPCRPLMLAEGDRIATESFFDWIQACGFKLNLVLLANDRIALQRRQRRGTEQNETWVKGRRTSAQRLAVAFGALVVDAAQPLAVQAEALAHLPPVRALAEARGAL